MTTIPSRGSRAQPGRGRATASAQPSAITEPPPNPLGPISRGRGKGKAKGKGRGKAAGSLLLPPDSATPRPPNIVWDEDRVKALVKWLVTHPADRHILYHDRYPPGTAPPPPSERPVSTRKKNIYAAITEAIFDGHDPTYSDNPDRFASSVGNRLVALKREYRDHRGTLKQTGAGVHPDDPQPNLHVKIREDFPHYDQLDEIWHNIPGFDSDLVCSDPTEDHVQSMLSSIPHMQPSSNVQENEDPDASNESLYDTNDVGDDEIIPDNGADVDGANMEVDGDDWEMAEQPIGLEDVLIASDDADLAPFSFVSVFRNQLPSTSDVVTPAADLPTTRISAKAAGKMRTPSSDSRAAFRKQQTPYTRSLDSARSSNSVPSASPSAAGPSGSTTKKATSASARLKNEFNEQLSDFTRDTESHAEEDSQRTRRYVARMNFAVRDKELEMERERFTNERTNGDLTHRRELDRVQKDIELKNAEENCIARQVEMLQLQIQLEGMRQRGRPSSDIPQS